MSSHALFSNSLPPKKKCPYGTTPHVVEPKYPGTVERYVNMGDCYDKAALWPLKQDIMDCMSGYKGCYQRAYRCLGAAAEIMEDQRSALLTDPLAQKLAKRARSILSREIPRQKARQPGQVKQRFLSAITHKGPVCLYGTVLTRCGRVYVLTDNCGLAHELLIHLLAGATANGYDTVACPDPMAPDRLAHLLVPRLGLAFLSRLRFAKKVSAALVEEAVSSLAQAKAMHDDLEAIYNPHVDFGLVDRLAQDVWQEISTL